MPPSFFLPRREINLWRSVMPLAREVMVAYWAQCFFTSQWEREMEREMESGGRRSGGSQGFHLLGETLDPHTPSFETEAFFPCSFLRKYCLIIIMRQTWQTGTCGDVHLLFLFQAGLTSSCTLSFRRQGEKKIPLELESHPKPVEFNEAGSQRFS